MKRIRIMHVIRSLETGGTEEGVRKLLAGLPSDVFEQTVCTVLAGPAVEPRTGTRVLSLQRAAMSSGFLVPALARVFAREQPHIVHSRNWGSIEAVPAARLRRIKGVVHSEHGLDISTVRGLPWRRRALRRLYFGWADHVFTVSNALRDYYAQNVGGPARRLGIIPNGVNSEHFCCDPAVRRDLRRKLGVDDGTFVVGTASRLDPIKDHRTLLRAAALTIARGIRLRLVLIGDGPERGALEREAQDHCQLREHTVFVGESNKVAQWLNSFDVFVLPSLAEGMSNTLLEAMAVGIPPIATRASGNPEVVEEGESGLLFPPGDVEALAAALQKLAADMEWRRRLGINARARVENHFSLRCMLQNYARMYEDVLRGKGQLLIADTGTHDVRAAGVGNA